MTKLRAINWQACWTIARRDLTIVLRSKMMILPIILVPIIITLIPAGIALSAPLMDATGELEDLEVFFRGMPPAMRAQFEGQTPAQQMITMMVMYIFAPMFLILPVMVASTIAAGAFAGEKERKTLEALLYTPTTDLELFLGKVLVAWLPAIAVALMAFVIYTVVVNLSAWKTMGHIFFPNAMWFVLVFWMCPAAAALGLGAVTLVSSKASSYQDAMQIGGMVVLPMLLLVFGQIAGVLYLNVLAAFIVGIVIWIAAAVLIWLGVKTFHRSEIIAKL